MISTVEIGLEVNGNKTNLVNFHRSGKDFK
jgi:hypothetical protein